jgi:predicted DNA-binding antitoxin AbrB/MazE fold protein
MPELKPLWEIQLLDGRRRVLEIKLREGQMSGDLKEAKNEIEKGRVVFNKLKALLTEYYCQCCGTFRVE